MDNNFEDKFNQIKDMLGKGDMPDALKNLVNMLGSQTQSQATQVGDQNRSNGSGMPFDAETMQMFLKLKQVLDMARNNDDPRERLLFALKPYLSNKRRDKVDELTKMLKMAHIMEIMTKLESSEDNEKPT